MPRRNDIQKILVTVTVACAYPIISHAQVDCFGQKTIVLSTVRGSVHDMTGEPIRNAEVSLVRDHQVIRTARTGTSGEFKIEASDGSYWLRATAPGFGPSEGYVELAHDLRAELHPQKIWFILGVGMDAPCPAVTSNHREFMRLVSAGKKKYKETSQNNATQK